MIGRWLAAPAPPERLAVFRVLLGIYCAVYLAIRLPAFLSAARLSSGFEPVGVLWFLDAPLPSALVVTLVLAAPILAVLFASGFAFRYVGPAFAIVLLVISTYRSSFGRLLYFDNLMMLHVLVLAASPAADAVRWHRTGAPQVVAKPSERYGWPLRLAALVTVVTYMLAGVAKLRLGGLEWLEGSTLRNHVAYSAARLDVLGGRPSPVAGAVMGQLWLFTPAAIATVVLELGAPALLYRRVRVAWVVALWCMHVAIAAAMFVVFPYPLFLLAFAPFFPLERLRTVGGQRLAAASRARHSPRST